MPKLDEMRTGARLSRRSLTKAAGVAVGALAALSAKPPSASADDNNEGGGGSGGGGRCFLRGTRIHTATGYRKVEDLAIGDFLPTVFGAMRPIQWISSHSFTRSDRRAPWPHEARPVRIAQAAIDDNVPDADLYLTASHALFIDGALVPVGNLVNGTTITLDDADEVERLEYFNIKLENHDVIEAQGASCESLLEVGETDATFADYCRKYGPPKTGEAPCAPLLSFNGGRSEVKSRLRSAISLWIDRRQPLDVIRDRLEERGIALRRSAMLAGSILDRGETQRSS
jgi:hypothetical protein